MSLTKYPLPKDLLTLSSGGTGAALNRQAHPEFAGVSGEPTYSQGRAQDAMREAFAALQIARQRASSGDQQQIYIGDAAVQFLYGRAKLKDEQDCDVIGYILRGASYGYVLGEGKGADILKAKGQLDTAMRMIAARKTSQGPIFGGLVVTPRLRYFEWNETRQQWVAYLDNAEERNITDRLQPNVAKARPSLQRDRVYLLDGPEEGGLPTWNIVKGVQPFTIYVHDRRSGNQRGTFRPLSLGAGGLEIYYVS